MDRRIERSINTRKKLIEAAKAVFVELGYHQTTIKSINEKANTGHGTIYSHFADGKDELLATITEEIMQKFYKVTDIVFEPSTIEEAYEIISQQVYDFLLLADENKKLLCVFYEGISVSESLKDTWEDILNEFFKRIKRDIQHSKDNNLAKLSLNSDIVSKVLLYSSEHFLQEIIMGDNTIPIKEIADNITKVYMFGLYL